MDSDPLADELEKLLLGGEEGCAVALREIKVLLFRHNLGEIELLDISRPPERTSLRGRLWKAILGVPCDFKHYDGLLKRASHAELVFHPLYSSRLTWGLSRGKLKENIMQIDRDITRTFKGSRFVTTDQLSRLKRVLSAYQVDFPEEPYIQGMNSMAAVVLCLMPELDAYFCYRKIIQSHVPTYFCRATRDRSGMQGANVGVAVRPFALL